ncbi:CpaF/VirB11 family protein [Erythrobacter aureus]|nr:ATPase, T2SS/T4P/T4SS family [Erythrobacter aureus]
MDMNLLQRMLAPLAEYYEAEDYEEVAINQPGEIWCRRHKVDKQGRIWVRIPDERFTLKFLTLICRAVANTFDQKFDPADPTRPSTVFATLPPHEHRFGAIAGMNIVYDQTIPEGGIALCIRKGAGAKRVHTVDFSDWGLVEGRGVQKGHEHIAKLSDPNEDAIRCLKDAVQQGCNILISGGTSTGKTTLFNRIIEEVDERTRIITVEDTREIKLKAHPNHAHLILSRTDRNSIFTYDDAIDVIMRFTPDIVLVGEISTSNAGTLWKLTGTGHGAMMTTIHASTVDHCYDVLFERISANIPNMDRAKTIQKIRENFCIIQMSRDLDGNRVITDIAAPIPAETPDSKAA